jgi:hypothetical protein
MPEIDNDVSDSVADLDAGVKPFQGMQVRWL